jgi:hypothetical protein
MRDSNHPRRIRQWLLRSLLVLPLVTVGCDVDQTEEGEMPEVEVRGGNLPEYDVDTPEVEVRTEQKEIEVPDVDVTTERKSVNVPDIDVIPADEADQNEVD